MFLTRGAGVSIKPGVKRSGTPGTVVEKIRSPRSGRQPKTRGRRSIDSLMLRVGSPRYRSGFCTASYRPLRGLNCCWSFDPGAYAPGFMLSPPPQAEKSLTSILHSPSEPKHIMLLFNAWFFSVSLRPRWRMTENRRTLRRRSFCTLADGTAVSLALSTGCSRRDWAYASTAGRLTARPHASRKSYVSGRVALGLDSARDAIDGSTLITSLTRGAGVSIKPGVERGFASGTPGTRH
jgi:hypothetical protein